MKHLVSYQREVYKGKLTAVVSFCLLRRRAHTGNVSFSKLVMAVSLY